jgi:hypothetical protein
MWLRTQLTFTSRLFHAANGDVGGGAIFKKHFRTKIFIFYLHAIRKKDQGKSFLSILEKLLKKSAKFPV